MNPLFEIIDTMEFDTIRLNSIDWPNRSFPQSVLVAFDIQTFDPSAFARHNITFPSSIQRSVLKRQAEFFMGRLAARHALQRLGTPDQEIGTGAFREPQWPRGIAGSITHSHCFAAAIAMPSSACMGVGIDIEQLISTKTQYAVESTVIVASEQTLLERLTGALSYEASLAVVFSAKESFFKGTFATVGRYFGFEAVELTAFDVAGGTLELTVVHQLATTLPVGKRFMLRFGFIDLKTVITTFLW
jgi:4'-phosphopantetheinyl transferase EntD